MESSHDTSLWDRNDCKTDSHARVLCSIPAECLTEKSLEKLAKRKFFELLIANFQDVAVN